MLTRIKTIPKLRVPKLLIRRLSIINVNMSIATQEKIADFVQNVKQMATEAVDKVCYS